VILTGRNFIAGTTVRVGIVGVAVVRRGTTELSFVTPSVDAAGVRTITVETSAGQATTTFEFAAPTYDTHAGWRRPSYAVDRYTAFETALPLLPDDTNGVTDIYVHDEVSDTLRRVSVSTSGREAMGGESTHAAMSATGRFVAFESLAANLVYGDTNTLPDVFLHDRDADEDGVFDELGAITTIRVSVGAAGAQAIGGASSGPSVSGNGRFVAFESSATNLDAGDGNGVADVFVHDRLLGRTRRVSLATDGSTGAAGASLRTALSQDGRFVAFDSAAVLTAGDTNAARDVFVHDRDLDGDGVMDEAGATATRRLSVSSAGAQALGGDSVDASITANGRYVVFASKATTLVAGDTNGVSDVFLQDRDVDGDGVFDEPGQIATRRVSVGAAGTQFTVASGVPRISANGKLLVFLAASATTGPMTIGHAVVAADTASDPGKATPWTQPDPTSPAPQPPGKSGSGGVPGGGEGNDTDTEDPATSPDGDQWGGTDVTDVPKVVTYEEPREASPTPYIAVVSPHNGAPAGGALVTIEGRDLDGTLYWNDAPLTPLLRTSTRWTLVAPPQGNGPAAATLVFIVDDRRSNVEVFTYVARSTPRWTAHSPGTAPVAGNVAVTVTGSGFDNPGVTIGRLTAAVTAWTPTSMTATVPASYAAGPMPLTITNGDGADTTSDEPFIYQNTTEAVTVSRVEPQGIPVVGGAAVTIYGTGFTADSTVSFGTRSATSVQFLSSRALVVQAPPAPAGASEVVVRVGQSTARFSFDYVTPPSVETCAGPDTDADGMGDAWETQYGLVATDAADGAVDPDHDGLTNAQECQAGSHPRSFYTRYLAEGATGSYFDTRVAIANPNSSAARVLLRFQTDTGSVVRHFLLMPATSRQTIDLRFLVGLESANVSTVVESDVEVVVDRTMRWDRVSRAGAHAETSAPAPSLVWYLAEGATHGSFDLFYLLQNPSATQAAQVEIRYLLPSGPPLLQTWMVAPNTRRTIYVDQQPGLAATDVSAVLTSVNGVPIIVERAMYASGFAAGHESAGVTSPSLEWFLAEGSTGGFFDTFVLLANSNDSPANIHATYLLPSGQNVVKDYVVPANSRRTLNLQFEDPALGATAVSTRLTSTNGVSFLAERSMWWPHGQVWYEAHNAAGATTTGTKWAVADGEVGQLPEDTATFYLIANTSPFPAAVRITILSEAGQTAAQDFVVPANSRASIPVVTSEAAPSAAYMLAPRGYPFGAIIESLGATPAQIVVERAMYWHENGQFWAAGSDLLATRLR
jgi:Tol biopolymer transport system component